MSTKKRVLEMLKNGKEKNIQQISKKLGIEPKDLIPRVSELCRDGLLEITGKTVENGRRYISVSITKKGQNHGK